MTAKLILILTFISTSVFAQIDCDKYPYDYVPIDLNDALEFLDCLWRDTDKEEFKNKPEGRHFGTGMGIRNSWELWSGDTEISQYFRNLGITHADDMSGIILTSFHRYLNNLDIKLDEQIAYYKEFWRIAKIEENERKINRFNSFSIGDTIYFQYNYSFISTEQEDKYDDYSCIATGLVLATDKIELLLQIKLIDSCDDKGIIISKTDIYELQGEEKVLIEKDRKEIMKIGEIAWTDFDMWTKEY